MSATPDPNTAGAAAEKSPAKAGASRKNRKTGKVVSDKMEKTVVVEVTRLVKNERYGRYQKKSATFLADDRVHGCRVGDVVEIEETRPLSAKKRWRVKSVVTRSRHAEPAAAKRTS